MFGEATESGGPVPVMDEPTSFPSEAVDLHAASAAVRAVLARARSQS